MNGFVPDAGHDDRQAIRESRLDHAVRDAVFDSVVEVCLMISPVWASTRPSMLNRPPWCGLWL